METILHIVFIILMLTVLILFVYSYLYNKKELITNSESLNTGNNITPQIQEPQRETSPLDEKANKKEIIVGNEPSKKKKVTYLYLLPTIVLGTIISISFHGFGIFSDRMFYLGASLVYITPAILISLIVSFLYMLFFREFPRLFFIVFTYVVLVAMMFMFYNVEELVKHFVR